MGISGRFSGAVRGITASLIATVLAVFFTQIGSNAQSAGDALPYARGYLVTGNYVAAGTDLNEQGNPPSPNGISTGTINIVKCSPPTVTFNCVPADADIVAAYLYWEMIIPEANPALADGVMFRGEEILLNDVVGVKASNQPLTGSTSSCWSSGSPLTMVQFRADVLRFLPIRLDKDNQPTGKRLVTNADLTAHNLPLNSVSLPTRSGNQIPESAGASLVLVYRDPNEPLRKIVFYDGIHIQSSITATMSQTIRGIYKSSTAKSAQVTHILGSGQPNNNERVFFNNGTTNTWISPPDPAFGGSSSQRGWSTLTYDVSDLMTPLTSVPTGFGETVTTTVNHTPANGGYDCLAWAAVIFSTAVADVDHDGLPDGIEDATSGLNDPPTPDFPNGQPLPNLNVMGPNGLGASSAHPDIFLEFNAMRTLSAQTHGSANAKYPGVTAAPFTKDVPPHNHMPTPEVLKLLGDAYMAQGIHPHFDVGSIASYKALPQMTHADWVDNYNSTDADAYLIPTDLARGGEVVDEKACSATEPNCRFPAYPGTVSWKVGMQLYRDSPVANNGTELPTPEPPSNWDGRRRFDRNRRGLFHYVFNAHYRGASKSDFPCLNNATNPPTPIDYPSGTSCTGPQISDNGEFHTPTSASGIADLPGGNVMTTLGFWDDFVGRPFVRASTTFHELGHNLNLWHGGAEAIWGNKALNTASFIEPNCKPNYLSSMSYLFQVHGMFDDDDEIHLGFSSTPHNNLTETTPANDAALNPLPDPAYRTAWYAPATSPLATSLGVSEAKRFCHGEAFGATNPHMARVYTLLSADPINWDGADGTTALADQDVNFDHALNTTMLGFNDWASVRLDQISAGRNAVKFQDGDFLEFGSGDFIEFGSGDFLEFGSGDFLEFGSGDFLEYGSGVFYDVQSGDFLEFGSGDFIEFGSGDFLEFGSGDFLEFGSGSERQELDFELAKDLGRSRPYRLRGCVVSESPQPDCVTAQPYNALYHRPRLPWTPPSYARVALYDITRKQGTATSTNPFVSPTAVSTSTSPLFVEQDQLADTVFFTYRTRARFDDGVQSGYSKTFTIQAQNVLPTPNHANGLQDTYQTRRNTVLTVSNPSLGVRGNDDDPDSPQSTIVIQLAPAPPNSPATQGTVTLNPNGDGTFTFTPKNGFTGLDYFYYTATNGQYAPGVPMNSQTPTAVQVVINVTAK